MKPLLFVTKRLPSATNIILCDRLSVRVHITSQRGNQHQAFYNNQKDIIRDVISKNINLLNKYYERFFGIAEVRQIQAKVLETESKFVDITRKRKSCQDKIDEHKQNVKELREKLDNLPRSSDNYLNLITIEHKLLRDQLSLEAELSQLKEKEQLALDSFSALLRQSHEIERLRQDRSKYWQIITAAITTVGYTVALITQKSRSQKSLTKNLEALRTELSNEKQIIGQKLDDITKGQLTSDSKVDKIQTDIRKVFDKLDSRTQIKIGAVSEQKTTSSWTNYIPGFTTFVSWFYCQKQ